MFLVYIYIYACCRVHIKGFEGFEPSEINISCWAIVFDADPTLNLHFALYLYNRFIRDTYLCFVKTVEHIKSDGIDSHVQYYHDKPDYLIM